MNTLTILLQGGGGGGFNGSFLLLLGGMFIIMYFFMIRPQQKKAKEQSKFIENLQKGDRIVTAGGIHGKIVKVDEKTLLIEVDSNTKLRVEKSVVSMDFSKTDDEKKAD